MVKKDLIQYHEIQKHLDTLSYRMPEKISKEIRLGDMFKIISRSCYQIDETDARNLIGDYVEGTIPFTNIYEKLRNQKKRGILSDTTRSLKLLLGAKMQFSEDYEYGLENSLEKAILIQLAMQSSMEDCFLIRGKIGVREKNQKKISCLQDLNYNILTKRDGLYLLDMQYPSLTKKDTMNLDRPKIPFLSSIAGLKENEFILPDALGSKRVYLI